MQKALFPNDIGLNPNGLFRTMRNFIIYIAIKKEDPMFELTK